MRNPRVSAKERTATHTGSRDSTVTHLADIQVEVQAEVCGVCIDVLHPSVEELVQVIQVILTSTATAVGRSGGLLVRHAGVPSVIDADHLEDISTGIVDHIPNIVGSSLGVIFNVIACRTRSATCALVRTQLEKTDPT